MFNDEYEGQGGSYVVGKDGKRKLIERTEDQPAAATEQPAEQPTETTDKTEG